MAKSQTAVTISVRHSVRRTIALRRSPSSRGRYIANGTIEACAVVAINTQQLISLLRASGSVHLMHEALRALTLRHDARMKF
jgi:hypothetical protein